MGTSRGVMGLLWVLCGCAEGTGDSAAQWDRGPNPHALDDLLRLNHIQTKGSHNSYHQQPPTLFDASHDYSHPPLTEQLDLHVRQFELDVHRTAEGTWQVFHLPSIDEETSCLQFADCLQEIKDWSDAHGWHVPITVWLEPKDDLDALAEGFVSIGDDLPLLDDEIRAVFPDERLFTPDDLRGDAGTLQAVVTGTGWPLLGEVRGMVIFALLDNGAHRETYLRDAPELAGRVMFVDSSPDESVAALIKDGGVDDIAVWSAAGFVVTSNGSLTGDSSDGETEDEALKAAGTHHIASDFVAPSSDAYWLDLSPRCNPITAPVECEDAEIERLLD